MRPKVEDDDDPHDTKGGKGGPPCFVKIMIACSFVLLVGYPVLRYTHGCACARVSCAHACTCVRVHECCASECGARVCVCASVCVCVYVCARSESIRQCMHTRMCSPTQPTTHSTFHSLPPHTTATATPPRTGRVSSALQESLAGPPDTPVLPSSCASLQRYKPLVGPIVVGEFDSQHLPTIPPRQRGLKHHAAPASSPNPPHHAATHLHASLFKVVLQVRVSTRYTRCSTRPSEWKWRNRAPSQVSGALVQ